MKRNVFLLIVGAIFSVTISRAQVKQNVEKNVAALLQKMTLEEKIGQMAQVTVDVLGEMKDGEFVFNADRVKDVIVNYKLGSVLNTAGGQAMTSKQWRIIVDEIQKAASQNRLKVPVLYGFDAIHGATYVAEATMFPQQIGQAATFNRSLVREGASITAAESRACNVPWNFSPVLDIGSNVLWPRLWETYGEDPYLVSEMGVQAVAGYQNPIGSHRKMIACLKHFLAYGEPKSGKDRTNAWIPEYYLREYHLPPFAAAIKAGARTVMVNSSLINGIPVHSDKKILTDLLKKELGFTGFVITDWQDIDNIYRRDKIVATQKESIMLAINAGIDMAMIPYGYKEFCDNLKQLVLEKKVSVQRINDAVSRILRVKFEAGLFDDSNGMSDAANTLATKEYAEAAYNTAAESITLLKNDNNVLPMSSTAKVLIAGPNANTMRALNGGWSYSWQGDKAALFTGSYNTIVSAFEQKLGKANVKFVQGVAYKMTGKYYEDSVLNIDAIATAASDVDYIILCLGENSYTEKPGDLSDLNLSSNQIALAQAAIKTGKPIVLVLNEGRPRIISTIEPYVKAVVMTYLPGNYGADALADIVLGRINPSGKLPFTYPRYVNALTNYIHKPSDEQSNPQGAYDYSADFNPQYLFGFGMSYTSFQYANLKVNKSVFTAGENIQLSVTVKNVGTREGKEAVQVYVSDLICSLSPDVQRLRAFEKISLKAGEEKVVSFSIPIKNLAFVNTNNKHTIEKGEFNIRIENLTQKITVTTNATF